jgi:competence protein ComEA
MPRRSLLHLKPGTEPPDGVAGARHRLSATLGGPDGTGPFTGPVAEPRTGLLEPAAEDAVADQADDGRPASPGARRRTGLRAATLLGVVAVVLGGWFWWNAVTRAPDVVPLSDVSSAGVQQQDTDSGPESAPAQEGTSPEPTRITVHVAGAVARPGVVELPAGSRLHEALAAAGGPTGSAEPDRLNLAAVVEDGQRIVVPERGQPEASPGEAAGSGEAAGPADSGSAASGSGGAGVTAGGSKINLNTAGVEELGTLPRVGPVLAQRIVDWRKQHGRFQTVDELDAVDGVGPKLLEALLPLVRV